MACCQAALLLIIVTVAITLLFAEGQNCRNPVPGLDRQSRGVDVAILDLLPLDFTGQDGYKSRIFDYTCSQNKTMDINGVTYQVPDQVWSIDSVRGGWMSSQVNILKNYEEVKSSMSRNVGGGTQISKFGFSSCVSYTQMQHTIVNTSHYIEQVTAFDSATRIDFLPYWDLELGSTIQRFIAQRLPARFLESTDTYEEFINYFGTHYFKSARFGGLIMMYMRTSSEYYVGRSERDIKIQAEESFLNFLRGKASIDPSARAIDEQFRSLTSTTMRYYGGNTNLLSTSSLAEWQPTVMANPWLFSAELAPVSELITDSAKRLSMERAILNHLLYGYVQELERLIQAGRARWKAALTILDSLSDQLHVAKSARLLNQATIEYLGNTIKEQVTIPSWFIEQTQLCYQWYPDDGLDECRASQRLLCSLPNTMTSYYLDETDDSKGGCQMRWGIIASGQAGWFQNVQMAYCQLEKMVILAVLMLWKFTESQECHNPVPGLDRQSRGVDVAMLDLLPLDFNRPDGYKARIIEYTCTQNKTMELNEVTYQIPDQVSSLDNIPSGWLTSQVNIFRSYDEVKASMSRNAGGGLLIRKFGFSRSTSYTEIQHSLVSSLQYIEQVTSFESATRVDHLPYWNLQLGPTVMEFINSRLTSSFQENPDAYEEFINYFGTHYFKSAKFGGLIMMLMKTSSEYYLDRRVSDVINQAEASFSTFLTERGVRTQTGSIVDERFRQLTSTTVRYFGGNTNLLSNSGLSEWQPTVLANPWLFSAELAPITDLITDTTKRQSMESAITNHLLHGYLQELERLLTARRSQWNAATSTLEGLLTQVQAAKAVRILNQTSIEDLGVNVKEQVTVPTWFTEQTHLCFEWYPDEGLDECSAPQRLLCSLPNTNMSFFLDDTDNSRGGCQMRWGITATGHPEWFEQVGVCYRWQTNGDGRQCNGMANGEYCAPVNSYTTFYRDDTFKLAGGCQMSWRLVVQDSAPAWAHNIQLCFDWFAQQDGYQCGQGASYNLCALANQWTAYYLDDTDNRKGGCYMRWSLKFH